MNMHCQVAPVPLADQRTSQPQGADADAVRPTFEHCVAQDMTLMGAARARGVSKQSARAFAVSRGIEWRPDAGETTHRAIERRAANAAALAAYAANSDHGKRQARFAQRYKVLAECQRKGMSSGEAAKVAGCNRRVAYEWALREGKTFRDPRKDPKPGAAKAQRRAEPRDPVLQKKLDKLTERQRADFVFLRECHRYSINDAMRAVIPTKTKWKATP